MTKTSQSDDKETSQQRLADTGRNDTCPCGSGKKYKKCHLREDEEATANPVQALDAKTLAAKGWRLFEQQRPGAAEKQFRAALQSDEKLSDARVGVAMARLSADDSAGARSELETVIEMDASIADKLQKENATDAFIRAEAQPYVRACHALGCLAYDEEDFDLCASALKKVYAIDAGAVGSEARMVAAKAFMKKEQPAQAAEVLEPALKFAGAVGRAQMGLALAHFAAGNEDKAKVSLAAALESNPYLPAAIMGDLHARAENPALAAPGSREEAGVYAQSFGDVWDAEAKAFLKAASGQ